MCSDWANQWCTLPCPCDTELRGTCRGWNCFSNRWFCQRTPMRWMNSWRIAGFRGGPQDKAMADVDAQLKKGDIDIEDLDIVNELQQEGEPGSPVSKAERVAARRALRSVDRDILTLARMTSCDRV